MTTRPGEDRGARTRISVVLATFNGARHLDEQLASLSAQTRQPDELVVSDDGSTDGTLDVVARFASGAGFPVRVVRQPENLGPDQNFGAALAIATGEIVLCCDQDDRWHPDKLAMVEAVFRRDRSVGLVLSDARVVDERMRPTGTTLWQEFGFDEALRARVEGGDAFAVLARRMPVYGCTMAVRRSLADRYLPVPPGVTFDSWIGQVVSVIAGVRLLPAPLVDYRQHAAQYTGFATGGRLARLRALVSRSDAGAVRAERQRLHAMERRLAELPETPTVVRAREVTEDRLRLTARRIAARSSPALRVPLVVVGVVRGEYRRGAQGLRSAVVDLLAPRER